MQWNGDAILQRIRTAAMRGVVRGTEAVHARAVRSITSGPKTGEIYRRRGVEHQASAPGEAPASDTGLLVRLSGTRYEPNELSGFVNFAAKYAAPLEFGTFRMEPRPFLRPALEAERQNITDGIAAEIRREFEAMG